MIFNNKIAQEIEFHTAVSFKQVKDLSKLEAKYALLGGNIKEVPDGAILTLGENVVVASENPIKIESSEENPLFYHMNLRVLDLRGVDVSDLEELSYIIDGCHISNFCFSGMNFKSVKEIGRVFTDCEIINILMQDNKFPHCEMIKNVMSGNRSYSVDISNNSFGDHTLIFSSPFQASKMKRLDMHSIYMFNMTFVADFFDKTVPDMINLDDASLPKNPLELHSLLGKVIGKSEILSYSDEIENFKKSFWESRRMKALQNNGVTYSQQV
jgi:hypothetical protein